VQQYECYLKGGGSDAAATYSSTRKDGYDCEYPSDWRRLDAGANPGITDAAVDAGVADADRDR
jgi:hypothetical protein